jgi:hypothetical protein
MLRREGVLFRGRRIGVRGILSGTNVASAKWRIQKTPSGEGTEGIK